MPAKYCLVEYKKEHMSRALGRALPISRKASIEICNAIRNKSIARAKTILNGVMKLKKPIEYKRFTNGAGHKKGMAAGKYPQKASGEILSLINTAEANAQFKGLNTANLIITHISAHNAGNTWKYGRQRRRKQKRTNIQIVLEESKKEEKKKPAVSKPVPKIEETK